VLTARTTLRLGPVSIVFDPRPPSLADISPSTRCGPMFGSSVVMRQVFSRLERVAQTDVSVVVLGETGTGKEVFAHAIHSLSPRAAGPFVVVDCASIAPSLAEAALFGHERGAFTGATSARISPFVQASGGTLFLDELGELPLELQSKLLRALAEQKVQPLGASSYRPFDTRIVAATRRDLTRSVADASFRSDLYFRLAKLVVQLPPLRERTEDIPGLIRHFVELLAPGSSLRPSPETLTHLLTYDWPGNIRELRNAVEVAVALVEPDGILRIDEHLVTMRTAVTGAERTGGLAPYHDARKAALETFERAYFQRLAVAGAGNLSEMGRQAKLDRNHVRRYLVTHGLLPTKK
jgi:DNA-binding NtrC family response regulator